MRLEFDSDVPRADQLLRMSACKKPGRKHRHTPSVRAKQKHANGGKANQAKAQRESRAFHQVVAAYWRGERDTYPSREEL